MYTIRIVHNVHNILTVHNVQSVHNFHNVYNVQSVHNFHNVHNIHNFHNVHIVYNVLMMSHLGGKRLKITLLGLSLSVKILGVQGKMCLWQLVFAWCHA